MGKKHLKRLAAPKTWQIKRENNGFVTKPLPGPHGIGASLPLSLLLTEVFGIAETKREARKLLNNKEVKVDCMTRENYRFPVGIFDTLEFPGIGQCYRMTLSRGGKLSPVRIPKGECPIKPCKIVGKTMSKGKLQLNLYDGRNIIVDKSPFKVGDTVMISLPEQKITKHLALAKKSAIFLTGGKHTGETGIVEDIIKNRIIYKDNAGGIIETSKRYAFVIGDGAPLVTVASNEPDEKHQN